MSKNMEQLAKEEAKRIAHRQCEALTGISHVRRLEFDRYYKGYIRVDALQSGRILIIVGGSEALTPAPISLDDDGWAECREQVYNLPVYRRYVGHQNLTDALDQAWIATETAIERQRCAEKAVYDLEED